MVSTFVHTSKLARNCLNTLYHR